MRPLRGGSRPAIVRKSVVFPAPFAPRTTTIFLAGTTIDKSCRIVSGPMLAVTFSRVSAGVSMTWFDVDDPSSVTDFSEVGLDNHRIIQNFGWLAVGDLSAKIQNQHTIGKVGDGRNDVLDTHDPNDAEI